MSLLRRASEDRVAVRPDGQDWRFVEFEALRLPAAQQLRRATGSNETLVVVLGGVVAVRVDGGPSFAEVGGRSDVWGEQPAGLVLLPPGCDFTVTSGPSSAHLAIAGARSNSSVPPRQIAPSDVLVERRGEGQTFRRVHHLLPPAAEADRLIAFEVFSPGGNWSSFPPHKHDTDDPPRESLLEELYYFGVNPPSGFALQRIYTADGSLDESLAVRDGDLVLVPRGYHTVAASPGHDVYYLNIMAGPTRVWNFTVDPAYESLMNWKPPGNERA